MAAATIVDSTDGTLARKVRIKEVVPSFDGRRLDDIVDFLNYTFLPLLLIWRAGILPAGYEAWLFLPLLASVYGFCQVQAKTDDGYFLGFPSLWNLVALYLYVLPFGAMGLAGDRDRAGAPDFRADPKHLYPSQPGLIEPVRHRSSACSGRSAGLDHLEAARQRRRLRSTRRPCKVAWASLLYPAVLPGRLVGHQRGSLDAARAGRRLRGRGTAVPLTEPRP